MKKLSMTLAFILFTSCNIAPSKTVEHNITIDTGVRIQNQLKEKWIQNTQPIVKGSYKDGKLNIWFDRNNLWKEDDISYSLLGEGEASFIDENTAIMSTPYSTSPKLLGNLYIIRISNNTIYRTKNPNGFIHIDEWDGKTVSTNDIIPIALKYQAKICFLTEIQNIKYQYAFNIPDFEIRNNGKLFQVGTERGFIDNELYNIKYTYYTKGIDDYHAIYQEIQAHNKKHPRYHVFRIDPTTKIVYFDIYGGVSEENFNNIIWETPNVFMSPKE